MQLREGHINHPKNITFKIRKGNPNFHVLNNTIIQVENFNIRSLKKSHNNFLSIQNGFQDNIIFITSGQYLLTKPERTYGIVIEIIGTK